VAASRRRPAASAAAYQAAWRGAAYQRHGGMWRHRGGVGGSISIGGIGVAAAHKRRHRHQCGGISWRQEMAAAALKEGGVAAAASNSARRNRQSPGIKPAASAKS